MVQTLEDFVEDMVSDGNNARGVRILASKTRWKNRSYEAYVMAANIIKKLKRKRTTNSNKK